MYIDILNASNVKQGPGPVTTATRWRYTQRLSRAGEWQMEAPATDPRIEAATLKRQLHAYHWLNFERRWIGGGTLERRNVALRGDDTPNIVMSGNDVLFELARETVNLEINWDSPYIGAAMFDRIMADAPAGWSITVDGPTPNLIARFADESILNALVTICDKTGQMFRLDPLFNFDGTIDFRRIKVFSTIANSGVLATNRTAPLAIERNLNACLIEDIDRLEDASKLINQAIPYGAGTGQARFTPYAATLWPDGSAIATPYETVDFAGRTHRFAFNLGERMISDLTSIAEYGAYTSQVQFKEITPITNGDADTVAAANALVAATVQWLLDASRPQDHYSLNVVGLRRTVYPGQSIRVVAKQYRDGRAPIDINQDLIIQEVVSELDIDGLRPVALTVATTREFAATDAQILAREIQKSLVYQAHPQIGPSENTISYRDDIDDDYGGSFPFWLSRGTTQISSVILRFKLDRLRSTVKSVGGTATGTVDIPPHTHTVAVAAHTHSVPDHQHKLTLSESGSAVGAVGIIAPSGSTTFMVHDATGAGTVDVFTNASSGSTTASSGGGQTPTSNSGGGSSGLALNLANAISAVYGIYEDPDAAYVVADLAWAVNAVTVSGTPTPIVGGWYELDLTSYIINPLTLRPTTQANTVAVNVAPATVGAGKKVRVTAQIEIRSNIQSIAVV